MADDLEKWLNDNYCHPELAYWLPHYIRLRGTRAFSDFPLLSPAMKRVAASQDLIPWVSFMEGKLSKEILHLQRRTLALSPSRMTINDWSSRLISKILHISHAQWVFRNVSLHDAREGYLHDKERREILAEVDRLSQLDPASLPERSRYLLEIDFEALTSSSREGQSYWLLAMKAAVAAGRATVLRTRRATARHRRRGGGGLTGRSVAIRDSVGRRMIGTTLSGSSPSPRPGMAGRQRPALRRRGRQLSTGGANDGFGTTEGWRFSSPGALAASRDDNRRRKSD